MSLTNAGFDGTVTELPFAYMWAVGAGGDAVESSAAWAVTQGTGRQVSVAAQNGYAFGRGILSKDSGAILQALSTPVAGGWFLICRHIDWTTNTVTVVALTGPTSTTTIPTTAPADFTGVSGMATSPGVTYDHPLAWAWVRNTDTTMALFDLRKIPTASRVTTLEAAGAIRSGASGGAIWEVTSLAALDALSLAKIGDLAYMTDPGLGVAGAGTGTIDAIKWEAISGVGAALVWRIVDLLVVDFKSRLDSFVAAVAALPNLQFKIGNRAWRSSAKRTYQFTSIVGDYRTVAGIVRSAGPIALAGTGAAIGAVTLNPEGSITVVGGGTGATALDVQIPSLFDTDFDDYDVDIQVYGASGNVTVSLVLNAGTGADNAGANYDTVSLFGQNSLTGSGASLAQTSWAIASSQFSDSIVELKRPNINAQTTGAVRNGGNPNPMTAATGVVQVLRLLHRSAYQASGLTVRFAGASVTGLNAIIRVTGKEKG